MKTRLICPHCQTTLNRYQQQYRCDRGHHFDLGKAGDINLLLPQQKRSQAPGDSKAMVAARAAFLASGAYQPIAEWLAKYLCVLTQGMPAVIADAGCGEGYYLRQIAQLCYPSIDDFQQGGGHFVGWDISKFAVQRAAKLSPLPASLATWLTASNARIPLVDHSVDVLICAFGFEVVEAFARIIKSRGYLITLDVGERHLIELRRHIYPTIKPYHPKPHLSELLFRRIKSETLSYQLTLGQAQLSQLLIMTPHGYRASPQAKNSLLKQQIHIDDVDVKLTLYRKNS